MVKIVFFDHGRIVFAASNLRRDRLGEALVADGRITQQEFDFVSTLMRADRSRRFGEALVQAGVMDRYEVGTAVARQVRRVALSFFELADGAAVFEERACSIPLEYMISLSVHRLLYDGIRGMKSQELVLKGLGYLDRGVVLAEVPPFPYEPRGRATEELEILDLAQKRVTVRRLGWAEGGLTFPRLRSVYALLAAGILREADAAAQGPQPVVQTETGMFLLSALHSRPDPSLREAIRREVHLELEHSARLDREAWLKLARAAPRDELVRALEEKMERYHALLEAVGDDAELRTDIELILGRASTMLRLAKQPEAARETKPGVPAEPTAAEPPPEEAPAAPAAAPPATPARSPARAFADDTPAPAPLPQRIGREGGLTDPKARLEHLLMEAQVRMTVSDYANAVNVYKEVVELAPNVAAYRFRLAIAMTCYPRTAKMAEREFLEAVRLQPDDADLHYNFALYYKAMKVRSRAVAELRTAVRLDPRHMLARQELEALSPKDSALTSLKNLFKGR
jgi:tetratricopeptide (TPR) repeat protein